MATQNLNTLSEGTSVGSRTAPGPSAKTNRPRRRKPIATLRHDGSQAVSPAPTPTPTHEQIAKRAYEIWVAKGRPVGLDEENWRQAEAELRAAAR